MVVWLIATLIFIMGESPAWADPVMTLPPRPADARKGSEVAQLVLNMTLTQRENFLWSEFSKGNVPDHLRTLKPVNVSRSIGGQMRNATIWVAPDVLAVGSDADFVRFPMTPKLAQRIADLGSCSLPTPRMSDAIWTAAGQKQTPQTFSPTTYTITNVRVFHASHWSIEAQRTGQALGTVIAGTKKDVVIAKGVATNPGKVYIYGWHQTNGSPIQPLYGGHTDQWVDYSHGIRLVALQMQVDGQTMTVPQVLADPVLHPLLSSEGVITVPRYATE
jgi:hypothetical protein